MQGEAPYGGLFNNGLIPAGSNQYADLAFNPNAAPGTSHAPAPGDWDCWVVNRKNVPVPFDPQPPAPPGVTDVVNAVFGRLGQAFNGDTATLVLRLSQVYGMANLFHIDVRVPQPDFTVHIDVPIPALDASEHIDFSSPPISWSQHVDIPTDQLHADVPGSDLHVDVPASDLHVDFSVVHADFAGHVDVTEHIDVQSPHIDMSPHIDVPSGDLHTDVPSSQLHIDVPASDFAFSQHVDLGHIDVNPFLEGLVQGAMNPLALLLGGLLTFVDPLVSVVMEGLLLAGLDIASLVAMIVKVAGAHDTLDVALDTITAPVTNASVLDIGQPFLTGILASTLGTANPPGVGVSIGTSVGSIGFPASGLVGAGLEVALPVGTAFGFLQTEILDKMDPTKPFFGYVSIRLCPQTRTLLGMQQWPLSVMIEVVSFGDAWGRQFVGQLQQSVLAHMGGGNDAMLHWGLENDQLSAANLAHVPALQAQTVAYQGGSVSKLAAFKTVRSLLFENAGANPSTLFRAFDNAFTSRMGF